MTSTPDYRSFPRNELGEPLMDGAAYRFEQALDDYYDQVDAYNESYEHDEDDIADDPNYCDYHDAVHRTPVGKAQCRAEQGDDTDQYLSATPWDPADHHPERNDC